MIYGHIWKSQFRNEDYLNLAKAEWQDALEKIHDNAMHLAITECRYRYEMPPTLPQFYQLCRYYQPRERPNCLDNQNNGPRNQEIVDKYIKIMREVLANSPF